MPESSLSFVTPCVGVWIETQTVIRKFANVASHPAWVCGLKPIRKREEIQMLGHTLRGCVD